MIRIDKVETLEGVEVYGDSPSDHTFYVLPNYPRFRLDENGCPVFKFLKYRSPIDREGGKKGGGFVFFDVEFVVPEDKLAAVRNILQQRVNRLYANRNTPPPDVKIGTITYTKGTSNLLLSDEDGNLIEKIRNPGKPSLYGKNISSFNMEFTPEGATLFEQALQGKGGVIQVVYDLYFWTRLPPIKGTVSFFASKFYSFYQTIDVEWRFWKEDDYKETIRERFIESESGRVDLEFNFALPDPEKDEKLKSNIRDWAWRTLEDLVETKMIEAIAPVSEDDRKRPEGIENVTRDIQVTKIGNFTHTFREKQAIEWNIAPQGTLPNITSLKDGEGNPIVWEEYSQVVDLNDPFFKQLNVAVQVNADFARLPLHSVEVHLDYNEGGTHEIWEESFKNPDDIKKFATYIENNNWNYTYWYEVNYKGESRTFKSETFPTDEKVLTINVDDVGILSIEVLPGDINFKQVAQAQVAIQYEDSSSGIDLMERQYTLDKDNQQHLFQDVIFEPRKKAYRYSVKYFMEDGKEFQTGWVEGRKPRLYINDPFSATKTVGIRAVGNLETDIGTIYVDLKYIDAANDYTQTKSIALNKNQSFFDWSFPVIDETGGKVSYSGNIQYKDGTVEEIPETETTENTILCGKKVEDFLEIEVLPDLIDFQQVRLVKVSLHYVDAANEIDERENVIFRPNATKAATWKIELKDKSKLEYTWSATFYMTDRTTKTIEEVATADPTIVLELPQ